LHLGGETRRLLFEGILLKPRARAMSAIGDVNGDGFDDFAMNKTDMAVTVDIYFGAAQLPSPLAPVVMQVGLQGTFGSSIAGAGDVNGDGLADLAIGDHSINSSRGAVTMYFGVENSYPFDSRSTACSMQAPPPARSALPSHRSNPNVATKRCCSSYARSPVRAQSPGINDDSCSEASPATPRCIDASVVRRR
jgi:hypothetical protein